MQVIRTIGNTRQELNIAKNRLDLLLLKKEKIYTKYFPITPRLKEIQVDGGDRDNDKMALYVAEINDPDEITGKSLSMEIEEQRNEVNILEYYIKLMDNNLANMHGIEYDLYHLITVKGYNVSKAVEVIAERYNKDVSTIWSIYYPKIKKEIKKLNKLE